jgi:heat shock protein HslJ
LFNFMVEHSRPPASLSTHWLKIVGRARQRDTPRMAEHPRRAPPAFLGAVALVVLVGGVVIATRPTTTDPEPDPADVVDTPDVTEPVVPGDPRLAGTELTVMSWTTADGVEHPVPASMPLGRVSLGFLDQALFATTGCNDLTGTWSLDGGVLRVVDRAVTGFSCGDELGALEDNVLGVLTSEPLTLIDGNTVVLSAPDGRSLTYEVTAKGMDMLEEAHDTTVPLDAASWQIDGWGSRSENGRPSESTPTLLDLRADGTFSVRSECTIGRGAFTIDGATIRTSGEVTGDCDRAPLSEEAALLSILEEGARIQRVRIALLLETEIGYAQLVAKVIDHPLVDRDLWRVTGWTVDGHDHDVSESDGSRRNGDPIVRFLPNGRIGASAGCNGLGALYAIRGDELVVSSKGGTSKACQGATMELERVMLDLFTTGTEIDLDGERLVLRNGDTSMSLTADG